MTTRSEEGGKSAGGLDGSVAVSAGGLDETAAVTLSGTRLRSRTFLLGNGAGFVLYLPVEDNMRDRTMLPIKWFGVSEFGRKYLEACPVWVLEDNVETHLDRHTQTGFVQYLDRAVRTFTVGEVTVHQTLFVPDGVRAFFMTLEADAPARFAVEPEFDMRYYQTFNTAWSGYEARVTSQGRHEEVLSVHNRVEGPQEGDYLEFYARVRPARGDARISLLPETERLREKTYLKDEEREKLIRTAYDETHETVPDEAPIWDTYSTHVYAPARIEGAGPLTLIFAFGATEDDVNAALGEASSGLADLQQRKDADIARILTKGNVETGVADVDRVYAQVLTRFDTALVVRNATVHAGDRDIRHFSGIFAGNKYFLDAWKRDENISLVGLLVTNQHETVRAILDETWQFQDPRTGRLPHIIRLGEPLVYYSSDGTLWALRRLHQYTRITGDRTLLEAKYGMVEHFFTASLDFVKRGLLPSGGIIDPSYRWETWEDTPYTPRDGYPVEIELLWLTALADYLPVVRDRNPPLAERLTAAQAEGAHTFELFYLDGYLADSLSYDWTPRTTLTPNGYVAFDLDYPLPAHLKRSMVLLARDQLAGHTGVRGLAMRDWAGVLSHEFTNDPKNVHRGRMASVGLYNYHRGIEWLWLNQFLVAGELRCGDATEAYWTYLSGQVHSALHEGGIGGLSELYDSRGPLGADFQAWSMAGFIASLHSFAGAKVDAIDKSIRVRPSIPDIWPRLRCRYRVGSARFDLSYRRDGTDAQIVEIHPLDPVPSGYVVEVGVRVPPVGRIFATIDGEPVPTERIRSVDRCAPDVDAEAWIDTGLRDVVARFGTESASRS